MSQFSLPTQTIPTNKLKIPMNQLKTFLEKNRIPLKLFDSKEQEQNAKKFSKLFDNVYENLEDSSCSTEKPPTPPVQKKKLPAARTFVPQEKSHIDADYFKALQEQNKQRIHNYQEKIAGRQKHSNCMFRQQNGIKKTRGWSTTTDDRRIQSVLRDNVSLESRLEVPQTHIKNSPEQVNKDQNNAGDQSRSNFKKSPILPIEEQNKQEYINNSQLIIEGTNSRNKRVLKSTHQRKIPYYVNYQGNIYTTKLSINLPSLSQDVQKRMEMYWQKEDELEKTNNIKCENDKILSHMFIVDDHDRFGNQLFPIALRLPNPGPCEYQNNHQSLEQRIIRIQLKQEQQQIINKWQQKQFGQSQQNI